MRPINTFLTIALLCCTNQTRKWRTSDHGHVVLSSIVIGGPVNDGESVHYCPNYGHYCRHNYTETLAYSPDRSMDGYHACCERCESRPSTMSCCADIMPCKDDIRTDQDQSLVCIRTSSDRYNDSGVLAVATCPEQSDTDLHMKCGQRYKDDGTYDVEVHDVLPVRDVNTNILYRNRHCAFCNGLGITEIEFWALSVDCHVTGNLNIATDSDLLNTIRRTGGCHFIFKNPTPDIKAETCSTSVCECNVTGKWEPQDFNLTVLKECVNGYENIEESSGILYKNFPCRLCNEPESIGFNPNHMGNPAFSMLLTFNGNIDADNVQPSKCAGAKVFSHAKGKCIKARCSLLRQLRDNACKRTVPNPDRFAYRIGFRLTPQSPISVDTGYDIIPSLGEQINKFLKSVFPADVPTHVVYELLSIADVEYTDIINAVEIVRANLTLFDVRFKFVNAEPHDPEERLVDLIGLEDEAVLDIFTGQLNVSFKLMLMDDFMHFPTMTSPMSGRCSFQINNFSSSSCADRNYIPKTYKTFQPYNLTAVPYKVFKQFGETLTFYETPITYERNILELRKCPFVKIQRKDMAWKETEIGIEFAIDNHAVPVRASEYVYGDTSNIIWMCLETHERILRAGVTSFADYPCVDLILNVPLVMFSSAVCYAMVAR